MLVSSVVQLNNLELCTRTDCKWIADLYRPGSWLLFGAETDGLPPEVSCFCGMLSPPPPPGARAHIISRRNLIFRVCVCVRVRVCPLLHQLDRTSSTGRMDVLDCFFVDVMHFRGCHMGPCSSEALARLAQVWLGLGLPVIPGITKKKKKNRTAAAECICQTAGFQNL